MSKYYVVIERVSAISVPVDANSADEAADLVNGRIARGEILCWDFDPADVNIEATDVYDSKYNHLLTLLLCTLKN